MDDLLVADVTRPNFFLFIMKDETNDVQSPILNGNHKANDEYNETRTTCINKSKNLRPNNKKSIIRKLSLTQTKHVISTKDLRTAFMLFVVTFLYIAFYFPSIAATYLALFQIQIIPYNLYINYLYCSSSAINPMIYCFMNPTFRADLIKLFFKRGFLFNKCANHVNMR